MGLVWGFKINHGDTEEAQRTRSEKAHLFEVLFDKLSCRQAIAGARVPRVPLQSDSLDTRRTD